MFPGMVSKLSEGLVASAATITVKTEIVRISGSTAIATINAPITGFSGLLFLIPITGSLGLLNSGNIAIAATMPVNQVTVLVYSRTTGKWYPGAIS